MFWSSEKRNGAVYPRINIWSIWSVLWPPMMNSGWFIVFLRSEYDMMYLVPVAQTISSPCGAGLPTLNTKPSWFRHVGLGCLWAGFFYGNTIVICRCCNPPLQVAILQWRLWKIVHASTSSTSWLWLQMWAFLQMCRLFWQWVWFIDLTMDACATKCASSVGFIFAPFASTVAGRTDCRCCDGNMLKVGRPPVTEQWYLMVSVCALWCRFHQWPTHHYFWVPMLHYFSSPGHLFAVALLWCGDGPIFRRDCWNQEAFRRLWRTGDLSSGRRLSIGKSTSTIQVASPSQRAPEELCDKCLRSLHRTVERTERKRRVDSGGSGRQFRSHLPDGKQYVTGFNSRTVTGPHGHRFPNNFSCRPKHNLNVQNLQEPQERAADADGLWIQRGYCSKW